MGVVWICSGSMHVKNWKGETVHKYAARLRTMKTILFPVVDVEHCCPSRAVFGQKIDHMHQGDNAHAIVSGPGGRWDGIEMGREQHGIIYWHYS
jgi:hypothetical protein